MTAPDSRGGWSEPGEETDGDEHPFRTVQRYDEIELVGRGGMGEVVVVHDRRLGRDIALKRVAPERTGGSDRLAREAWITARLEHPSIVPVHDAGEDAQGRLFYTMRLVHGCSLADALASGRTGLLRHYLAACEAVAYAHSHGIVHRDLKPANIMVGSFGETQVVDWGLAGYVSESTHGIGTAGYMSPEQAAGDTTDARSDVWALGAILHEVVYGAKLGLATSPRQLELSAIIDRATHAQRHERYRDAGELAADVERFLDGRRVTAHAYSTLELVRRLAHRLRVPLLVAAGIAITAIVVLVASFQRIESARDRAVVAEADAHRALGETERTSAQALSRQAITELDNGALAEAEILAAHALARAESPDARGVIAAVRAAPRLTSAEVTTLPGCDRVIPGTREVALCHHVDGIALWDLEHRVERWRVPVRARQLVLADRRQVVALVGADELLLLDGATGKLVQRLRVEVASGFIDLLAVSRDGMHAIASDSRVVTTLALAEGRVTRHGRICGAVPVGSLAASRRGFVLACLDGTVRELALPGTVTTLLTSPIVAELVPTAIASNDRTLIIGGVRGDVAIVDRETSQVSPARPLLYGRIAQLAMLADGIDRVAIRGEVGGIGVWDLAAGRELLRLPDATNIDVRLDARGVLGGGRGAGRWTLPVSLPPHVFTAPAGISAIAASPDGRFVAAARGDGKISIWSIATGRLVDELALGTAVVKTLDFSRDSRELAASLSQSMIAPQRFAVGSWLPITTAAEVRRTARRLAYTRDGSLLAVHYGPPLSRWDARGEVRAIEGPEMIDLAMSPDRETLWLLASDGGVWRMRGDVLEEIAQDRNAVAVAAHGDRIATAHDDGISIGTRWFPTASGVLDLIASPDGRYLIAAHGDGTISVRRFTDGALVATLRGHRQRVAQLAFLPDGRLASAGWDGRVHTWDLGVLEIPAAHLVVSAERAWALDLAMALRR